MKTKKQLIYEFIVNYSNEFKQKEDEFPKIETTFLSEQLNMQRSNVSSALNQLVQEGKIVKHRGRPVLYTLADENTVLHEYSVFSEMIGFDQSLKEPIQMIKVALSYPTRIPSLLLVGAVGTGAQAFAEHTYRHACSIGVLKKNSSFITIDASLSTEDQLIDEFLTESNQFDNVNQGFLFLKNVSSSSKRFMMKFLEHLEQSNYQFVLMIHTSDLDYAAFLKVHFNFVAHIPSLKDRGIQERYQLVEHFLKDEAGKLNKKIQINYGLMQSLLLFPVKNNLVGLKKNLQFGVANAYARSKRSATIVLELSDFNEEVRKGLLYVKDADSELKEIIKDSSDFIFSQDATFRSKGNSENLDIYHRLDKKRQMVNKSINSLEMDSFVFSNIENELKDYLMTLNKNMTEQKLRTIVSDKLYYLVKDFVSRAGDKFNQIYSNEIFFGICLHLNNILIAASNKQRISNKMIMEILEKYDEEYFFSKKFIKRIESEFNVKFSLDETVFLTLFLTLPLNNLNQREVVTLVAMHGENGASSIVDVVKKLMPVKNIYAFDLSLNIEIEEAYDKLKQTLVNINQGKGILVIYDMGSLRVMLDSIREETKLNIRSIEMPISLLAMSACKLSEEGHDIDRVYSHLLEEYSEQPYAAKRNANKLILALSSVKENKSAEIKEQLMNYKDHEDYDIVNFNIDDNSSLVSKINEMNHRGRIIGIVGTYNPEIFNLKFIDYYHLPKSETIQDLFDASEDDFDVFEYLEQQFNQLSRADLEITLIPFVTKIESSLQMKMKEDEKLGLLVHMTSLIDKLIKRMGPVSNFNVSEILDRYPEQVENVKQALLPIERHFDISISDGDAATIIRILLKC